MASGVRGSGPSSSTEKASEDALVPLGVVARPHGVHGELRVHRFNPDSTLLYEVRQVVLRSESGARSVDVRNSRPGPKGAALMTLHGVEGRDAAEALRGAEVCVPRSVLPAADEGEWYFVDLIGLRAETSEGRALGDVVDVIEYPTVDCLAVRDLEGVREVPLGEPYLVEVCLDDGRVILTSIDDLPIRKPYKHEVSK